MAHIEAILFDFDGTLAHTEEKAFEALSRAFQQRGIVLNATDLTTCSGKKWDLALEHLGQQYQVEPKELQEITRESIQTYEQLIQQKVLWTPGAQQAILELKKSFKLAIVSGSKRQHLRYLLDAEGLWDVFDLILGEQDYTRSKPDPEGFLKACQVFQLAPSSCLVFEDSDAGIQSAHAAKCPVVSIQIYQKNPSPRPVLTQLLDFQSVNTAWIRALEQTLPAFLLAVSCLFL